MCVLYYVCVLYIRMNRPKSKNWPKPNVEPKFSKVSKVIKLIPHFSQNISKYKKRRINKVFHVTLN